MEFVGIDGGGEESWACESPCSSSSSCSEYWGKGLDGR